MRKINESLSNGEVASLVESKFARKLLLGADEKLATKFSQAFIVYGTSALIDYYNNEYDTDKTKVMYYVFETDDFDLQSKTYSYPTENTPVYDWYSREGKQLYNNFNFRYTNARGLVEAVGDMCEDQSSVTISTNDIDMNLDNNYKLHAKFDNKAMVISLVKDGKPVSFLDENDHEVNKIVTGPKYIRRTDEVTRIHNIIYRVVNDGDEYYIDGRSSVINTALGYLSKLPNINIGSNGNKYTITSKTDPYFKVEIDESTGELIFENGTKKSYIFSDEDPNELYRSLYGMKLRSEYNKKSIDNILNNVSCLSNIGDDLNKLLSPNEDPAKAIYDVSTNVDEGFSYKFDLPIRYQIDHYYKELSNYLYSYILKKVKEGTELSETDKRMINKYISMADEYGTELLKSANKLSPTGEVIV